MFGGMLGSPMLIAKQTSVAFWGILNVWVGDPPSLGARLQTGLLLVAGRCYGLECNRTDTRTIQE